MSGFQWKLRRFKATWTAEQDGAPSLARAVVGFLSYADDTPRFGPADDAWREPEITASLPRFREVGAYELEPQRRAA